MVCTVASWENLIPLDLGGYPSALIRQQPEDKTQTLVIISMPKAQWGTSHILQRTKTMHPLFMWSFYKL